VSGLEWKSTPGNLRQPWITECGQYALYTTAAGTSGPAYVAGWHPVLGGLFYIGNPTTSPEDAKADCARHAAKQMEAAA
jgi:hypothetical protein